MLLWHAAAMRLPCPDPKLSDPRSSSPLSAPVKVTPKGAALRDFSDDKRASRMKIACVGGGPAGLYFAISMKLRDPAHEIEVFERNPPGVTFGWGVVFSDLTVENITRNDPVSADLITREFAHWDDIDVHFRGETITSGGHGFIGIGRKRLLEILQDRARELGVVLHFDAECDPADPKWREYDLVIASDGINSRFRDAQPEAFGIDVDVRANKFVWLGTSKAFDAFTFAFEETEHGWIWAHAYRFAPDCSTFIVECSEETWERFGFARMTQKESIAACEKLFAKYLDGHRLQSNASHLVGSAAWLNFRRIKCERWSSGNVVLLGDAAHTAHFSIGSGTKLALEDAIKLAEVLSRTSLRGAEGDAAIQKSRAEAQRRREDREDPDSSASPRLRANQNSLSLEAALDEYQAERSLEVLKLQNSARNSTEWFETLERYTHFEPLQFAYSLLTREPADQPREPAPARPRMAGDGRTLVLEACDRRQVEQDRAADVRAVQAARDGGAEPRHGLADGDVFGGRRRRPTTSTSSITASARSAARGWSSPR